MKVKAYAKLNLTLDILGRRDDGYHDMQMVMQSVDLCDELTVTPAGGPGRISTSLSYLPCDERNLARQAARAFRAATGSALQVDIDIVKRIPVCAGMAGGSSDAAAVLRAMNELSGAGLSPRELAEIGGMVGSDVPYCVLGGTMLAEGRGERLRPLPPLPACHVVVCKPAFSISTPQLFAAADSERLRLHPDTAGMLQALERGDLGDAARRLYNVFTDVLPPQRSKEIRAIAGALLSFGALGSCMSGTGPAVFGLFRDAQAANAARASLAGTYSDTFLCRTLTPDEM